MAGDVLVMLTWSIFLLAAVKATAHLQRHMGILVASQSSVMSIAALIDITLLKRGVSGTVSGMAAVSVGLLLGLVHLPILLQTGAGLLFILTAISQIVLVEAWLALPAITGGSNGILLSARPNAATGMVWLLALMAGSGIYIYKNDAKAERRFDWSCLKSLGLKAEAFGVPSLRLYVIGFALYGVVLSATGVAATRILGYLTVTSFGLTWSLAVIMIVLYLPARPLVSALVLSVLYSSIRVLFRQSVYASSFGSHVFEMLFPLILLLLIQFRPTESKEKPLSSK
ncbi:MAG TPA: hypothetical protein VKA60_16425 [Blastocatellia bacterium]|nr:hypothetical protein [Blastocatellia bacterium]